MRKREIQGEKTKGRGGGGQKVEKEMGKGKMREEERQLRERCFVSFICIDSPLLLWLRYINFKKQFHNFLKTIFILPSIIFPAEKTKQNE